MSGKLIHNIENGMRHKGLNQKGLALKAGLNETAVRDILKGRSKDPQISTLRAIARVLGVTAEELYQGANLFGKKKKSGLADKSTPWPSDVGTDARDAGGLFIEEVQIAAAAGPESLTDKRSMKVSCVWQVPGDALPDGGDSAALRIVRVEGDAMAPDFIPGDRVVIDTADRMPSPAGVFLLWDGVGLILRRCEVRPDAKPARVTLRARNPDYGAHEVALKDMKVCGRVIGRWQKI